MPKHARTALIAATLAAAIAAPALAQENPWRSGRVTIENENGGVATIDRHVEGDRYDRQGYSEITGPNGNQTTREWRRTRDPETGTWTRDSVAAGPNGGQRSRSFTGNYDRETETLPRQRTVTDRYGDTRSFEGRTVRTAPGEFENTRSYTNRNGQTRTRKRWIRVE